jgi:TusA-related sulfurtransferase
MSDVIDARGLSCPQPVLMTVETIKNLGQGELVVLVDTQASRENVSRAARGKGWEVKEIKEEGDEFHIHLASS